MPTHVICTAGHVDHGKSALVRALTGMEPDRFDEEQRRGLTIDLGFAWMDLGRDRIAFVDLPGHLRFVRNMLAGAGPVRACLLVVAADEGWMPQSQEHLEILDLLGVTAGLVAVTKADLVDTETLDLAVELVREELAGTGLAAAGIVPVSARTGQGLDRLSAALGELVGRLPPAPDIDRPRLWVDRAFSVRGAGTVVTGTLVGGRLLVGDEVVLAPGSRPGRIRTLHNQNDPVPDAGPGTRVAVNLTGARADDVRRGDAVVRPGQWLDVMALEGLVRALPDRPIDRRGAWALSAGAGEWPVTLWPVSGQPVEAGGSGFVRVELPRAAALAPGDRFVLREAGRAATMGGGVVLDVAPAPRAQGRRARAERIVALRARADAVSAGDWAALAAGQVRDRGWLPQARLPAALGRPVSSALVAAAGLVGVGDAWADPDAVRRWAAAALEALGDYHGRFPVRRAAPRSVPAGAAEAAGCPTGMIPALLDRLLGDRTLVAAGGGYRLAGHEVRLSEPERRAGAELLRLLAETPFAPPGLAEAAWTAGASADLVRELTAEGSIVLLDPDIAMTTEAVGAAHAVLLAAYREEGGLSAGRVREILGTSRKYALPLLAELDRTGRTRRRGDLRDVLP